MSFSINLSLSTEQKIHTAFRKAASYCTDGLHPNEALAAASKENGLNPEMTRRSGEMLNIYLTHQFMKTAADRTATFPTADLNTSIKLAFLQPESAAPISKKIVVSQKSASRAPHSEVPFRLTHEVPAEAPRELSDLMRQLDGCVKIAAAQKDLARAAYTEQHGKAFDALTSLVDEIRTGNFEKFAALEEECLSEYGDQAIALLDTIAFGLPGIARFNRSAGFRKAAHFERSSLNDSFDRLANEIGKMDGLVSEYRAKSQALEDMQKQARDLNLRAAGKDVPMDSAADLLDMSGIQKEANISSTLTGLSSNAYTELTGSPSFLDRGVQTQDGAFDSAAEAAVKDQIQKSYGGPIKEADAEMENVKRKAILTDLVTNDEIISGMDPSKVELAYNAALQAAPQVTLNKEIIRSYLRNAGSQQSLDPFTAKQLIDVNQSLDQTRRGVVPTPKPEVPVSK